MIICHGILVCEKEDREGKTVAITGATVKENAHIVSANGNILGRILESQAVFRVLTDESAKLASLAGLVTGCPSEGNGNVLTGTTYLETVPFIKIRASLINRTALYSAVKAGNLYFGFSAKKVKTAGHLVTSCYIDKILLSINPAQKECKVYLDEV
jgi:hypothetical protein